MGVAKEIRLDDFDDSVDEARVRLQRMSAYSIGW